MNMTNEESTDSTFYDYTKQWTGKVNSGGLFEINDQSFRLFRAIEIAIQQKLPQLC